MNDEWIQKYKVPLLDDQRKMEEQLVLAGGRNEDTTIVPAVPPRMPSKVKAGWGLLFGGLIVGAAAVATMSVAEAFNRSPNKPNPNIWPDGEILYLQTISTGGGLLSAGGLSVLAGTTILVLASREKNRQVNLSMSLASNGIGISGLL